MMSILVQKKTFKINLTMFLDEFTWFEKFFIERMHFNSQK